MGKSTTEQKSTSSTGPWAPAQDPLKGILGEINGANLGANPYQGGMESLATDLLSGGPDRTGMVSDAYGQFQTGMQPHTSAQSMDIMSNPIFQNYLQTAMGDARNSVNSQFASAGRDLSPEHAQALSRGIAQGTAPAFVSAYDSAANRNLSANQSALSGAQSSAGLLGNLDAASLSRRGTGVELGNQIHALPLQNAALKSNLLLPIAGLGSEGQSTTTQTQKANPYQVAAGGILGGLGLMGGMGGMGAMGGMAGSMSPFGFLPSMGDPWAGLR